MKAVSLIVDRRAMPRFDSAAEAGKDAETASILTVFQLLRFETHHDRLAVIVGGAPRKSLAGTRAKPRSGSSRTGWIKALYLCGHDL